MSIGYFFAQTINILTKKIPCKYKNLSFLLLGILASFSNLFAQSSEVVSDFSNSKTIQYSNIGESFNDKKQGEIVEKHQVTVGEYVDFLNAVAADDSHRLYDERMGSGLEEACIARLGSPESYSYSVMNGRGELPIIYVSWFNQARFCNWLENGKPVGVQNSETTEDGSYTLSEASGHIALFNQGSIWFLPNNNEDEDQDNLQYFDESQNDLNHLLKSNTGFCIVSLKTPDPILMGEPGFMGITTTAVRWLFNRSTTKSFVGLRRITKSTRSVALTEQLHVDKDISRIREWREGIALARQNNVKRTFINIPATRNDNVNIILSKKTSTDFEKEDPIKTIQLSEILRKTQNKAVYFGCCSMELTESTFKRNMTFLMDGEGKVVKIENNVIKSFNKLTRSPNTLEKTLDKYLCTRQKINKIVTRW